MNESRIKKSYEIASDIYADYGVDVSDAVSKMDDISISLHCWQGDDVGGFENQSAGLGGGLAVTGSCQGKPRSADELRKDLDMAFSLTPGMHKLNLHAIYGDFSGVNKDRDAISHEQFSSWIEWALERNIGLDFNATCFGHRKASDGWTLSALDEDTRYFWVEHVKRCREIGAHFGNILGKKCIHNLWIPDGSKDSTVLRMRRREQLGRSLDDIFSVSHDRECLADSVESKLFGIGSEAFVAGSHEFYMQWVTEHNLMKNDNVMVCLDMGHFHPTESVADKISSMLLFQKALLIHASRGIRWDSDHVTAFDDSMKDLMMEIVCADAIKRCFISLDYFDASINRVGALVAGARSTLMSMLYALLLPVGKIRECELAGDGIGRLAIFEASKAMPFGAVWDYWCLSKNVPAGADWLMGIYKYEKDILSKR